MEEEKQRAEIESKTEKTHSKTPPETLPESPDHADPKTPEPPVQGEITAPLSAPIPVPSRGLHGGSSVAMAGAATSLSEDKEPLYNYVHYDPEVHWCQTCNVFPRTAKEFFNHLQSTEHKDMMLERKLVEMPWHKVQTKEKVAYEGDPTKCTPTRGLQFFNAATAWYCKLCDTWIGDLHCASLHLKSKIHTEKYVNFTEQNPHWEMDWLVDREKAYERKSDEQRQLRDTQQEVTALLSQSIPVITNSTAPIKEENLKKNKKERKKDRKVKYKKDSKKKKCKKKSKKKAKTSSGTDSTSTHLRHSSSSSSNSGEDGNEKREDKSKSTRVAMRNKFKTVENQSMEKDLPPADSLKTPGEWQSLELKEGASTILELRPEKEQSLKKEQGRFEREQKEYKRSENERYEREKMENEELDARFPPKEDKMLCEWMDTNKEQVSEREKQMLSSIKDRVKMKQEEEKNKKQVKRDRYYRKWYYDKGYRRRRRGDSPVKSGGERGRSRSPEERRRGRSKPNKYKRSQQRAVASALRFPDAREGSFDKKPNGDKKNSAKHPDVVEQDEAKTEFKKQAAEAAARLKKKLPVKNIPKSKPPFIGPMPFMKHLAKKKGEAGKAVPSASGKPPEGDHWGAGGSGVQDMDIDEEGAAATLVEEWVPVRAPPPPAPYSDVGEPVADPSARSPGSIAPLALPKDFREALEILFPGEKTPTPEPERESPPENPWNQDMAMPGPHQKSGCGSMKGVHPMYSNMGPQGLNVSAGYHQMPHQEMMSPQGMPPHGLMGGLQDLPPHGMMGGLQDIPCHGMMGGIQDIPPHSMMGGLQVMPPHGLMGGSQVMPLHDMIDPHDMLSHGLMCRQDLPPHGMMDPQDLHPHGTIDPQDEPLHMMGHNTPRPPPPPQKQSANSDAEHSEVEGDTVNSGLWGNDDLALLAMDVADMAAQHCLELRLPTS